MYKHRKSTDVTRILNAHYYFSEFFFILKLEKLQLQREQSSPIVLANKSLLKLLLSQA